MQVIAAVVGRLSLAYEESAKSSYSDADGERRNKTNRLTPTIEFPVFFPLLSARALCLGHTSSTVRSRIWLHNFLPIRAAPGLLGPRPSEPARWVVRVVSIGARRARATTT